jgi:hypothetical protein
MTYLFGRAFYAALSNGYKETYAAPVWHKEFVSDAAGLSEADDIWKKPGCGCVGFAEDGTIIFANQLTWPECFIMNACDEKGVEIRRPR